ncbi:MAG: GlcG protein [Geminicoccus sp.]|jgi:uncharacterized protein GlcG (DUF336 family)|nr:GlcG protein [Geminicoccus sp.]
MSLTLEKAQTIIAAAFQKGGELAMKPLSVAVLDAGGHVVAFARQDGSSNLRFKIAEGKAAGAIALGMGSRAIFERAQQQPYFVGALNGLMDGAMVPVPGGVLIMENGSMIGGVGVTGDTSDNDEIAAIAGVEAAGFAANAG